MSTVHLNSFMWFLKQESVIMAYTIVTLRRVIDEEGCWHTGTLGIKTSWATSALRN